jgi:hypothetical protein
MGLAGVPIRALAARRLATMRRLAEDPRRAQEAVLRRLLRRAERTRFGREHGLRADMGPEAYRGAVPLRDYRRMLPWWEPARAGEPDVAWPGRIRHWALSSGTTSGEKHLPVSEQAIRSARGGGWDALVPFLAQSGRELLGGRLLFLGGCTALRRDGPVLEGDNTGILGRRLPLLARLWREPSPAISDVTDWETRIGLAARALVGRDVRMIGGVPSWVILFLEEVLRVSRRASLREIWPRLSLFVHGGVSFEPYRRRVLELLGDTIWLTDTYSASEGGMFAVEDVFRGSAMLPIVDRGVYFEFVPAAETDAGRALRVGIDEVEQGVPYAVAVTTDSGAYAYLLGDLVTFVSRRPLRLLFSGRLAHTLNAFGEHVSGGELDRAMAAAADACGADVADYAVAPVFPGSGRTQGGHIWYVEFRGPPESLGLLADRIDQALRRGNEDYASHRTFGLARPEVRPVPPGTFYEWMRRRGKLGGQNKIPRVLDAGLEESLCRAAGCGEDPRTRAGAVDAVVTSSRT